MMMTGSLFILVGPSGAGKTSVLNALLRDMPVVQRVITYTSKQPRPAEVNGRDYYFISTQEFQDKIKQGFFLEWSTVYGAYYGLPRSIIDDLFRGTSYSTILDRKGARAVRQAVPTAVIIGMQVPSMHVLRERLQRRAQDTPEAIERRLLLAAQEMEQEKGDKLYDYVILNDNFEKCLEKCKNIITTILNARP